MNGLKNISSRITDDAKIKAEAIIAEAQKNAADIIAGSRERAAADAAAAEKAAAAKCADIEEKARLSAQLDGKKLIANERQSMISQVYEKALEKLCSLPEKEYRALLVKLAAEVLSDGMGGVIVMNKRDAKAHSAALKDVFKSISISKECADIAGGLIIVRDKIEYNCTLEALMHAAAEQTAPEVSKALFSEGA